MIVPFIKGPPISSMDPTNSPRMPRTPLPSMNQSGVVYTAKSTRDFVVHSLHFVFKLVYYNLGDKSSNAQKDQLENGYPLRSRSDI